jgi:putative glutamine amidotransferase
MKPKIAIPVPHSQKMEYAERALPQYLAAIEKSGGEPVVIALEQDSSNIARQLATCDAALLPGSAADIDPQKYGARRHPKTADADQLRDAADELLLQDAHNLRKPIFGICYGLQSLNVWRTGTLLQDIPSEIKTPINHSAGRAVARAHRVRIDPFSGLARTLHRDPEIGAQLQERAHDLRSFDLEVNSSHHQAAEVIGDGLRISARCPDDNVIEALEGTSPGHFVIAVQWHPEQSYDDDALSRALFRAFIKAANDFQSAQK